MLSLLPQIRAHFPALAGSTVFLDNAGGSQLPRCVIDAVRRYMEHSFVQLGGDYPLSQHASRFIPRAREVVKVFLNGHAGRNGDETVGKGLGDVIFGSSSTVLCYEIASAYADARAAALQPDRVPDGMKPLASRLVNRDQIVVSTAGHEANVGPWMRLAARGYTVIPWQAEPVRDPATGSTQWRPSIDRLRTLVSDRTLLVLVPHVSNILGEVWDVAAVGEVAHSVGARVLVDGVAYAPHRPPDMAALGCDWYVYSTYKVFGPHMAAMFGTHEAMGELVGPNHYFIDPSVGPYKWELGNANHEGAAGVAALPEYIEALVALTDSRHKPSPPCACGPGTHACDRFPVTPTRHAFERAFGVIRNLEDELQGRFIEYLRSKPGVRIVGPDVADASRVATIAFTSTRAAPLRYLPPPRSAQHRHPLGARLLQAPHRGPQHRSVPQHLSRDRRGPRQLPALQLARRDPEALRRPR
jgi:selenocysteine lyase/cysteine desulfurase